MKKRVLFIFLIFIFLSLFPLLAAQSNQSMTDAGYSCLNSKIGDCSSLSLGQKIFSALATGKCISQVDSSMESNGGYKISGAFDIKTTSQAILALKTSGHSTTKSTDWLLTQSQPTADINWYLQIDSNAATSCTVSDSSSSYTVGVNADKTISNGAGSCLSVSSNGYWLSVSPSCYRTNFSVSCDQPFTTTELYQRAGYPTIYISSSSQSSSQGGTLKNSFSSYCFGTGSTCNYEASLWAALALDFTRKDISSYIPYLT
ncbi:MAG TPA: hypothetical protein VMC07_00025, partial [Candidatus Omnitrophota bacterium]|nr:hypothetical protein [Candidatus Omnitrophota bacterium]